MVVGDGMDGVFQIKVNETTQLFWASGPFFVKIFQVLAYEQVEDRACKVQM